MFEEANRGHLTLLKFYNSHVKGRKATGFFSMFFRSTWRFLTLSCSGKPPVHERKTRILYLIKCSWIDWLNRLFILILTAKRFYLLSFILKMFYDQE